MSLVQCFVQFHHVFFLVSKEIMVLHVWAVTWITEFASLALWQVLTLDIYLGSVLVKVPGRRTLLFMWLPIHAKPLFLLKLEKKHDGIAQSIEQDSSMYFQNIEINNIPSGYSKGIELPIDVEAMPCKKCFCCLLPFIQCDFLSSRDPHWFNKTWPLTCKLSGITSSIAYVQSPESVVGILSTSIPW